MLTWQRLRRRLAYKMCLAAHRPLQSLLSMADALDELLPIPQECASPSSGAEPSLPGISILIPERDNVQLLRECLRAATRAAWCCPEPCELVVVVDGSPAAQYRPLQAAFPLAEWIFLPRSGGFQKAIEAGLAACAWDWVYLLNNDMVLDMRALKELLIWRAPGVFAISSQIYFQDRRRRREETGWTDFRIGPDGLIEIFDRGPSASSIVRGNCYGGGGATLFQRRLLQQYVKATRGFRPFYWEDAAWGARAWEEGYQMLFCPSSIAWHRHRATASRFFTINEIERIFRRNRLQFALRRSAGNDHVKGQAVRLLAREGWRTTAEMLHPQRWLETLRARRCSAHAPYRSRQWRFATDKYYLQPHGRLAEKPLVLLVSPYAIFPPSHGAAARVYQLLKRLAGEFHFVVLSDEAEAYGQIDLQYLRDLASLHLVSGRESSPAPPEDRLMRNRIHCHEALRAELGALIACYHPEVVMIEHMELALLREYQSESHARWLITLHEVPFPKDRASYREADRLERGWLEGYDAVVACSPEDAALLDHRGICIVPNGMSLHYRTVAGSANRHGILFIGPFRYQPNWDGIRQFLREVYPRLRESIPDVELDILGGPGAQIKADSETCFRQPGVRVHDWVEDIRPMLDRCALTINPQKGIRGSCLKVADSLAAGRVCVTTRDGARGFSDARIPALIPVDRIVDFLEPLERLLTNESWRISIERTPEAFLKARDWDVSAAILSGLLHHLSGGRGFHHGEGIRHAAV